MSADEDRRQDLRFALPLKLWFNILKSSREYIRGGLLLQTGLMNIGSPQDLDPQDPVGGFLLRLEAKLDLILTILADNMARKEYAHQSDVVDVSENGVRILTHEDLNPGTFLEMGLFLPSQPYRTMDIAGEVVWKQAPAPRDSSGTHLIGIRFSDIMPRDQDQIVHWIFEKQREELRRRKELD